MSKRSLPAIAVVALLSFTSAASGALLERWRSYAGVSWDLADRAAAPAAFSGSVNAPIAGIHFDAKGTAYVSTPGWYPPARPPR